MKPRNEDFSVVYFARRKKTVYEYYYESCPYLLTHIDIDECLEKKLMKNAQKSMYKLDMIKDEAVLVRNCDLVNMYSCMIEYFDLNHSFLFFIC